MDGAVQENILPACQFRVEARTYFQQAGNTPLHANAAGGGGGCPAEYFQQGAFPCAVTADNAQHLALLYVEVHITQCPDVFARSFLGPVICLADAQVGVFFPPDAVPPAVQVMGNRTGTHLAKAILLADLLYGNDCAHAYTVSMNVFSTRLKISTPNTSSTVMNPKLYKRPIQCSSPAPRYTFLKASTSQVMGLTEMIHW